MSCRSIVGFLAAGRLMAMVCSAMARLVGETEALEAARTVVSWAHGFVSMELSGAFRLGGDLGAAYGAGITAAELRYLVRHEFVRRAEDVVWRRGKAGLLLGADEITRMDLALRAIIAETEATP